VFGPPQTRTFLSNNGLADGIIARSHQVAMAGMEWKHGRALVIVWSAPNYGYQQGNDACVMRVPGDRARDVEFWKFEKDPDSSTKPAECPLDHSYFA
jgi:hypothetical protein